MATNPTTEPRQGPAQTVVFTFNKAITGAKVTITEGTATAAAPPLSGDDVIVNLTGVNNQPYVTVSLSNISSARGGTGGSGSVRLGFLAGVVNQNRVVTVSDLGQVNAQLAQPVTAANYLKDINANGVLTVADKAITNLNLTKALSGALRRVTERIASCWPPGPAGAVLAEARGQPFVDRRSGADGGHAPSALGAGRDRM